MKKATHNDDRRTLTDLQQIVNIGPSTAGDFNRIGIRKPTDLIGKNPFKLFEQLCKHDESMHDPCVIDCFISAVDFMNGNPPQKWWKYTDKRKKIVAKSQKCQSD